MRPSNTTDKRRARGLAVLLPAAMAVLAAPCASGQTASVTAELAFGRFAAGSGGSITVRPDGSRGTSGGVVVLPSSASAAAFTIQGKDDQQVIVTLPADGDFSLSSGTDSMALTRFNSNRPDGVLEPGRQPLSVGATLQVKPNQRRGAYSGAFHIILEYQ